MPEKSVTVRELSSNQADELLTRAGKLLADFGDAAHPALIEQAPAVAAALDEELRRQCRPPEPEDGLFVLRGLPVADDALGPTPQRWSTPAGPSTAVLEVALLLLASALGRVFGWAGQQDGRLVHTIVPSPGHEQEQTGLSSNVLLSPHSEDAFHPLRAHFLMLGCLRNHDDVATHAACVRRADLDPVDIATLSEPTVPILPDDSYGEAQRFGAPPPSIPTLWHREDGLCLRFDPAYTPLDDAPAEYRAAYGRLGTALEGATTAVRLRPGDVLVIDNDTVVHGRAPFRARYDGTDRWLKRINIRAAERLRPSGEALEHGYGQQTIDPYR
jgi:Fe(II)/alpha-ketoglutarate-dependent arginine beta-hydroxylase